MRIINLLGLLFLCLSCRTDDDISGHWMSINSDPGHHYATIDIIDTICWYNKYSLTQTHSDKWVIEPLKKNLYGVSIYFLTLQNDTLITGGTSDLLPHRFFSRKELDFEAELFCDLGVKIELPVNLVKNCRDSLDRSHTSFISIGKVRWKKDSVAIQANDVFIGVAGISEFLTSEQYRLEINDINRHKVVLSIDKSTSIDLTRTVIATLYEFNKNIEIIFPIIDETRTRVCFGDIAELDKYYH
jgi:hypothetical protein